MALITKIREKSGIAAAAIAISLVLFLVGSDIFQGKSSLFGSSSQEVGVIAGESILIQDFQKKVEEATQNYTAQTGKGPSEQEASMIRDQVWNQLILDIAYKKEFVKRDLRTVRLKTQKKKKRKEGKRNLRKPKETRKYPQIRLRPKEDQ